MAKTIKRKSRVVSEIEKLLLSETKRAYENGAKDALSVAVNIFNCESNIRDLTLNHMKIK